MNFWKVMTAVSLFIAFAMALDASRERSGAIMARADVYARMNESRTHRRLTEACQASVRASDDLLQTCRREQASERRARVLRQNSSTGVAGIPARFFEP